ncbi:MAG: hypothetical protein JWM87_3031 [Candidatus Eremiobacteraeota bacterium]|nr:hypothetical protein [Candidatus Eremiobacteraeota bacterium]
MTNDNTNRAGRRCVAIGASATLAAAIAVVVSGCNASPPAEFSLPTPCTIPAGTQTSLIYPAPNTIGVPGNFGLIVLGSSNALPPDFRAYVVDATASVAQTYGLVAPAPSPLPTPNAPSTFPNTVYQASANASVTWPAGHTLTVFVDATNCAPTQLVGSFTIATAPPH